MNRTAENYQWIDRAVLDNSDFFAMATKKLDAFQKIYEIIPNTKLDKLLYLGSGADIIHPLLSTNVRSMTFVTYEDGGMVDGNVTTIMAILKPLIKPNYQLIKNKTSNNRIVQVQVKDMPINNVVFTLNVFSGSYAQYLDYFEKEKLQPNDYLMDKDSWLKDYNSWNTSTPTKLYKMANLISKEGYWIGGFANDDLISKQLNYMYQLFNKKFEAIKDKNNIYNIKWSGYEGLNIRQRTGFNQVYTSTEADLYEEYYKTALENCFIDIVNSTQDKAHKVQLDFTCRDIFEQVNDFIEDKNLKSEYINRNYNILLDKLSVNKINLMDLYNKGSLQTTSLQKFNSSHDILNYILGK